MELTFYKTPTPCHLPVPRSLFERTRLLRGCLGIAVALFTTLFITTRVILACFLAALIAALGLLVGLRRLLRLLAEVLPREHAAGFQQSDAFRSSQRYELSA